MAQDKMTEFEKQIVGRLSLEEACLLLERLAKNHAKYLEGYDWIVMVRAKDSGASSMSTSMQDNGRILATVRSLGDSIAADGAGSILVPH